MIKKCLSLYKKNEEIINYLIVGGFTTIVSLGSFALLIRVLNINYLFANIVSWILAVLFAYFTNKIFVFKSKRDKFIDNLKEMGSFFSSRIFTLIIDYALMILFIELFKIDEVISKLIVQIFILILNYVLSKIVVFKK